MLWARRQKLYRQNIAPPMNGIMFNSERNPLTRRVGTLLVAALILAGLAGCSEHSKSASPASAPPKRSVKDQLESTLHRHFQDEYARIQELANAPVGNEGRSEDGAADTTEFDVSCIRRGSGNEFACILTRYTWGDSAGGPEAPTAAHPDRRQASEQGFNAIIDSSSGDIQFDDIDPGA
jgi:hypothetical protein